MRRTSFVLIVVSIVAYILGTLAPSSSAAKVKDIEFKGYITQVSSPTSFQVDDYRITVENNRFIQLENVDPKAIRFDPIEKIKVGTFIKLKGRYDTETLEMTVKEIKIDMKQFRKLSHTVVLDTKPTDIARNSDGSWSGELLADARRILITNKTMVRFKLNDKEEKEEKEARKKLEKQKGNERPEGVVTSAPESESVAVDEEDGDFEEEDDLKELLVGSKPLQSLDDIGPGILMTYRGTENLAGAVDAEEVVFVRNEKTKEEAKLWKEMRLKQKEAKKAGSFAELKVGDEKYKVIPEKEVQDYVKRLGESLVPEYQRRLPDDDENKIPFLFAVVHKKDFNAAAYPTGTVIVHHDVFNYLENEAQLAFLLSHEIAHATQEHTLRQMNKDKKKRRAIRIGGIFARAMGYGGIADLLQITELAMINGYQRNLENQADRVGLANMIERGYDGREAPRTWKVVSLIEGDRPKLFWASGHDTNTERRSFLWLTIHNSYPSIDFQSLKRNSEEFDLVSTLIQKKYPSKRKRTA